MLSGPLLFLDSHDELLTLLVRLKPTAVMCILLLQASSATLPLLEPKALAFLIGSAPASCRHPCMDLLVQVHQLHFLWYAPPSDIRPCEASLLLTIAVSSDCWHCSLGACMQTSDGHESLPLHCKHTEALTMNP